MDSRAVALSAETGKVWLGYRTKYELERWDIHAETIDVTLLRDVGWFEDWSASGMTSVDADGGPRPSLSAIFEDREGLLYVGIQVADPRWRESVDSVTRHVTDADLYWDTIIEVIDVRRREVLGNVRFDGTVLSFLGEGRVAGVEFDDRMVPRVVVWDIDIQR